MSRYVHVAALRATAAMSLAIANIAKTRNPAYQSAPPIRIAATGASATPIAISRMVLMTLNVTTVLLRPAREETPKQACRIDYFENTNRYPLSVMLTVFPDHDPVSVNPPFAEKAIAIELPETANVPLSVMDVGPEEPVAVRVSVKVPSELNVTLPAWSVMVTPFVVTCAGNAAPPTLRRVYVPKMDAGAVESPPHAARTLAAQRTANNRAAFIEETGLGVDAPQYHTVLHRSVSEETANDRLVSVALVDPTSERKPNARYGGLVAGLGWLVLRRGVSADGVAKRTAPDGYDAKLDQLFQEGVFVERHCQDDHKHDRAEDGDFPQAVPLGGGSAARPHVRRRLRLFFEQPHRVGIGVLNLEPLQGQLFAAEFQRGVLLFGFLLLHINPAPQQFRVVSIRGGSMDGSRFIAGRDQATDRVGHERLTGYRSLTTICPNVALPRRPGSTRADSMAFGWVAFSRRYCAGERRRSKMSYPTGLPGIGSRGDFARVAMPNNLRRFRADGNPPARSRPVARLDLNARLKVAA